MFTSHSTTTLLITMRGYVLKYPVEDPAFMRQQPSSSYQDLRDHHSAYQVAALNELYNKDENPLLEDRTELADWLRMSVPVLLSLYR